VNNTSTPRILHIASGDLWAGAESQLFTLVTTLHKSLGITVSVVLLNHGILEDRLTKAGIEVIVLDETSLNAFQILRRLIHVINEQRPDVIHTHRIKENILGSIAALFAGKTPSLRTVHGAPEHYPSWKQGSKRMIRYLDRLSGRLLQDRVIAVSGDLAGILKDEFPPEIIHGIENGLDLQSFQEPVIEQPTGVSKVPGTFNVGIAGRLVPVKRVDLFIHTVRYILDHYPDMKTSFHIIGDGPQRNDLEKLSRGLNTNHIIHFEGHCSDIARKLRDLDILMLTSDHEGLPMVLLEAMALKVPIIAHATGGIPVLLDNGSCGALVEEHSPKGYAREVYRLSLSPMILSDITARALERVETHYSAEHNARAYLSQYNQIRKPAA